MQNCTGRQGSNSSAVHCHRNVLAAQSPVFSQLFQQMGPPQPTSKGTGKVSIRVECDPDAFNDVLLYMYSGRLTLRPEHAVELLWVSLHYEIDALARVYTSFLEQYLSIETVNILLNAALQFNLEHLVERCESFVLRSVSILYVSVCFDEFWLMRRSSAEWRLGDTPSSSWQPIIVPHSLTLTLFQACYIHVCTCELRGAAGGGGVPPSGRGRSSDPGDRCLPRCSQVLLHVTYAFLQKRDAHTHPHTRPLLWMRRRLATPRRLPCCS